MNDIATWEPSRQVAHIESLAYFDLLGFLRKETLHPGRLHSTRRLLDTCELTPSNWVLEVGCGTGASTVFAELRRVVKPGGYLGIVDFHYVKRPDAELLRELNRATGGHLDPLMGADWDRLLADAGWTMEDAHELPYGAVPESLIRRDHDEIFLSRPELGRLSEPAKALIRSRLGYYETLFNRNRELLAYRICRLRRAPGLSPILSA